MFRADLLSIIGSLNTVFTAIGVCHTSYADRLQTYHVHNSFYSEPDESKLSYPVHLKDRSNSFLLYKPRAFVRSVFFRDFLA
jgi:hypothetical protein